MTTNMILIRGQFIIISTIVMFLMLLCEIGLGHAYSPPIGIPDPWIDPDLATPARPDPWTTEQIGYYYVNYQTGTDSGRTYGTPAAPRATIPSPVVAGSYVEVHGTYNKLAAGAIIIKPQGTSENPVWIVGIEGDEPIFTDGKVFIYGSYCYIEHIKVYNKTFQIGTPSTGYQTDYIMVRKSEIYGDGTSDHAGITTAGSSTNHISNVIIYDNYVHTLGDTSATEDVDAHAITAMQYVNNVWILDNNVHDAAGTGIALGGYGASQGYENSHHIYVGRNTVYNVIQAGIATKYSNNIVISQNTIHDILDKSWSPSKGVGMQYHPQNTWVIYNTIYNVRYGIRCAATDSGADASIYVIGNLLYDVEITPLYYNSGALYDPTDSYAEAAIQFVGGSYRYVINNTIYNAYAGINLTSFVGTNVIQNNIVGDVTIGNHIWAANKTGSTISNNIAYQNDGVEKAKWGSSIYTLADFQSNTTQGDDSSASDPLFVDLSNDDFSVSAGSAAIDGGAVSSVYATFYGAFGVDISKDIAGTSRPQNSSWDIGAYEFTNRSGLSSPERFRLISGSSD